MQNSEQLVHNLKKLKRRQKLQIDSRNKKLDTILSQLNEAQISRQIKCNIHNGFQPLARKITVRLSSTLKYQSN